MVTLLFGKRVNVDEQIVALYYIGYGFYFELKINTRLLHWNNIYRVICNAWLTANLPPF